MNKALADAGYVNADAIERLQEQGHDLYVAVGREEGRATLDRTLSTCPAGATSEPVGE